MNEENMTGLWIEFFFFSISWIRVSYFFIFKYLELLNMIV